MGAGGREECICYAEYEYSILLTESDGTKKQIQKQDL